MPFFHFKCEDGHITTKEAPYASVAEKVACETCRRTANRVSSVVVTHVHDSSLAVQVDEHGRIIGLPDAVVDQIANRVIEKLKADGSLTPDPRLCGGTF